MIENLFLLLVAVAVLSGLFAIGGLAVEGWMRYEDHKKLRGKERL